MTDPSQSPNSRDDDGAVGGGGPVEGTPRWVKVFGIGGVAFLVLIVILQLFGGGRHGPGRHMPSGGALDRGAPAVFAAVAAPLGEGHAVQAGR